MNDHDSDVQYLERLLRDRVLEVSPDLDARAADGIRMGTRLRRRRQLWGTLSASAGVVAVVALGTQLDVSLGAGSSTPGVATDPSGHTAPTPSPTPSPTAPPGDCSKAAAWKQAGIPAPSADVGQVSKADKHRLARRYARLASSEPDPAQCKQSLRTASVSPGQSPPERLPVSLVAPGWTCGIPGDEKFTCTNGTSHVVITVRPANEHDAYLHDPDKAAPDQYVSDVHGKVFATIESTPNQHDVPVAELGRQLVWQPGL